MMFRHIAMNEPLHTFEHRGLWTFHHVVTLVIDADEVELRAIMLDLAILLAQQRHAMLPEKQLGLVFGIRVDLVIPVAAPVAGAAWRAIIRTRWILRSTFRAFVPIKHTAVAAGASRFAIAAVAKRAGIAFAAALGPRRILRGHHVTGVTTLTTRPT